jgi:hypothetical protein
LTLWLSVEGYLLSSYCSLFLPTAIGGDTVRIEYIARNGELPRSSAAAVVVWERASGLLALLLFLSVGILLAPILLDQGSLLIVASFTVSIVATIVLILTSRFGDGVRAPVWWATFTETLRGIQNPKKFAELVFWSLFAQFATIVIPFYFGLIMSGGDWNTAILLASITPIIWLITMIPVSLGGNGLREMSYVGIGELVGIDPMISLSAALGITFSNLIASVAGIYTFHQWSGRKSFSLESEE